MKHVPLFPCVADATFKEVCPHQTADEKKRLDLIYIE